MIVPRAFRPTGLAVIALTGCLAAYGQLPVITPGGILSAASWSSPVSPGQVIAIFGKNLATTTTSAVAPLPLSLGGTSVKISGVAAPLVFVSPTQVNAIVPPSLPSAPLSENFVAAAPVVVTSDAGSGAPVNMGLTSISPSLFTADSSGCGQAAALNITPDGVSRNSRANSVAPGDYVALFGTGFGPPKLQPPDGAASSGPSELQTPPTIYLDDDRVPALSYAGPAPTLAGLTQINFQVPETTRDGCSVPVSVPGIFSGPSVTLSVRRGRGQCADPPVRSSGQISLEKLTDAAPQGPASPPLESFSASFPLSLKLPPPDDPVVFAPQWARSSRGVVTAVAILIGGINLVKPAFCPVPQYSNLSAGVIEVRPPAGPPVQVAPQPLITGGVYYSGQLPAGFLTPGTYHISGTSGSDVALDADVPVGSPIQVQSSFPPGTAIPASQPLTVKWTGGEPGTLVRVTLSSSDSTTFGSIYSYADVASGSLTINPVCSDVCGFGLPLSTFALISVDVVPAPEHVTALILPGLTGTTRITWQYSFRFAGLTLAR